MYSGLCSTEARGYKHEELLSNVEAKKAILSTEEILNIIVKSENTVIKILRSNKMWQLTFNQTHCNQNKGYTSMCLNQCKPCSLDVFDGQHRFCDKSSSSNNDRDKRYFDSKFSHETNTSASTNSSHENNEMAIFGDTEFKLSWKSYFQMIIIHKLWTITYLYARIRIVRVTAAKGTACCPGTLTFDLFNI